MTAPFMTKPEPKVQDIFYPETDGLPMAENDQQYRCIVDVRFGLEQRYKDNANVYVGADLLIYYIEGKMDKRVAPDVFVAFDVPKRIRMNYLLWAEGKAPDVVFEIASPSTWQKDLGYKYALYQRLGVREYFLFDPLARFFQPVLQGYRLDEDDEYTALTELSTERGAVGVYSQVLDMEIWARSTGSVDMPYAIRLYDPQTDEWVPTPEEMADRLRTAEQRLAELEAELQRLRGAG